VKTVSVPSTLNEAAGEVEGKIDGNRDGDGKEEVPRVGKLGRGSSGAAETSRLDCRGRCGGFCALVCGAARDA